MIRICIPGFLVSSRTSLTTIPAQSRKRSSLKVPHFHHHIITSLAILRCSKPIKQMTLHSLHSRGGTQDGDSKQLKPSSSRRGWELHINTQESHIIIKNHPTDLFRQLKIVTHYQTLSIHRLCQKLTNLRSSNLEQRVPHSIQMNLRHLHANLKKLTENSLVHEQQGNSKWSESPLYERVRFYTGV